MFLTIYLVCLFVFDDNSIGLLNHIISWILNQLSITPHVWVGQIFVSKCLTSSSSQKVRYPSSCLLCTLSAATRVPVRPPVSVHEVDAPGMKRCMSRCSRSQFESRVVRSRYTQWDLCHPMWGNHVMIFLAHLSSQKLNFLSAALAVRFRRCQ